MTAVTDSSSTSSAAVLAALNKKSTTTTDTSNSSSALGQDAFLKLLITQLKNQSPLNPQDNTAFVAQLAQFSSLQGIQNLNSNVTNLSNSMQSSQALQASALVGRSVEVETTKAYLPQGGMVQGTVTLPTSTADLQLNIYDTSGKAVLQKDLGAQQAGDLPFAWDGTASDGSTVGAGSYRFEVLAKDGGKSKTLTTYLSANVNSVTIGANQAVMLNVNGVGPVALSNVKDIL